MRKKVIILSLVLVGIMLIFTERANATTSYTLNIDGGTISDTEGELGPYPYTTAEVPAGTEVSISATGSSDTYFEYWSADKNIEFILNESYCETTFIMPDGPVNIKANYTNRSEYTVFEAKDLNQINRTDYSNIDEFVSFTLNFESPAIGPYSIKDTDNFTLPEGWSMVGALCYDEDWNEVDEIEAGKTYNLEAVIKLPEKTTLQSKHYVVKANGCKIKDDGSSFPDNYLEAYPGTHCDDDPELDCITEYGGSAFCGYKCLCLYFSFTAEETCKVTFDSNGHGITPSNQVVSKNGKAAEPTALLEEGYSFEGWYTDESCTTKFDFNTEITENITLFAKWVEGDMSKEINSENKDENDSPKAGDSIVFFVLTGIIASGALIVLRKKF